VVDKLSTRPKPLTSFTADWLEVHVNVGLVHCTHCLTWVLVGNTRQKVEVT